MKLLLLTTLLTTVLVVGCSKVGDIVDTKTPPAKVYTEDGGRIIQLVVYRADSNSALEKRIGKKSGEARWFVEDNVCSIDFKGNDYETAGHELRHCLDGAFHHES